VTIEVTFTIDPVCVGEGQTTGIVAARLVNMGGVMFSWVPEMNGIPAKASFQLQTQAARDLFVADALKIPGVSLATVQ
jgi:hypothetical protein